MLAFRNVRRRISCWLPDASPLILLTAIGVFCGACGIDRLAFFAGDAATPPGPRDGSASRDGAIRDGAAATDGSGRLDGEVPFDAHEIFDGMAADSGGTDGGERRDGGRRDSGPRDSGPRDSGPRDSGPRDAGPIDACMSVPEECNDRDDDCDGRIDNDLTRACTTACGRGMETCSTGAWVDCDAPAVVTETCNGLDDDCDGDIDNGGVCPCERATYAGHTYQFCSATRLSWGDADAFCRGMGYQLITIDDAPESDFVWSTARPQRNDDWWIGLNDIGMENTFVWSSGSPADYRRWARNQPNNNMGAQDCVSIDNGSQSYEEESNWGDRSCLEAHPFVCETP